MHIFNNLPIPVVQLDPETRILLSNKMAHSLFEWKNVPEKLPRFTRFLDSDDTERFLDFYAGTTTTSSLFNTTLVLAANVQKRITIHATLTEEGKRLCILTQQNAWSTGCNSHCEHAAILEAQYQHNPGGILMVGSDMKMLSFNKEFVQIWGIPKDIQNSRNEEASLQCVLNKVSDPQDFIDKITSLYANHSEVSTDEVYLNDGRILYRHTYPIHKGDTYLGRVWYFLDITLLKKAQLQIEKQQIFQKAIIENVQDGIIACNSEGKINLMNRASRLLYGYTKMNPLGMDIDELKQYKSDGVTPTTIQQGPLRQALNGQTIENQQIVVRNHHGITHTLRVNGQTMVHDKADKLGAVISLHDITDLNKAKEQLKFMAYHDALTGLPNRRLFHDLLLQNLKQASRNNQKVGVLFLDIDNFKSVNDTHGHLTGDKLLIEVGKTLESCLRESDILCRWGGDEFVIGILENHEDEEIFKVAEKICQTVLQQIKKKNSAFKVSVTIGISICPDHGEDPDLLIRNADVAMYHAKRMGKNRCEIFSKEPMKTAN
jgi:diguanylate cyclase (GGDEF)-like protein/PAS domain S-box-containing protein